MNKSSSEPKFKQNKSNKGGKTDETRKRPKKLKTHKKKTISTNKRNNINLNIRWIKFFNQWILFLFRPNYSFKI